MSCLRNHCCNGSATILSLRTVVDLHVAVNTVKPLSTAMETLEWVPFALLSAYKIFSIAVSNINVLVWPATNSNSKLVITIIFSFLARSQSCEKRILAVSRLSVRPQWKNSAPTTRILMKSDMSFFRKPVVNIPLKPDQNNGYLTQGPMHTYDNISLNSS